ncbi:MAG: polysaccharide biosynthesis tyrosine autokinase, partial [Bacteroidota bacterium]
MLRGKWQILIWFTVSILVTALHNFTADRVYEATAKVLVDTRGPQASVVEFGIRDAGASTSWYFINNELQIMKSRSLAETVAKRLVQQKHLDESTKEIIPIIGFSGGKSDQETTAQFKEIVGRLQGSVKFSVARETDVIKITAMSTFANETAVIANAFANAYSDHNIHASRTRSRAAREFLESQLVVKKESLTEAESAMQEYMEKQGIVSLDGVAKKVVDQLSQFEATWDAVDVDLQSAKKTLASYQNQLAEQEPNVAKVIAAAHDPYIRLLQEQLATLEVQRDVTIAQNPGYVGQEIYDQKLKQIGKQVASLREKLQKRTDEFLESLLPGLATSSQGVDPAAYVQEVKRKIIELQVEVQDLQLRKKALSEIIRQYEVQFEQIPKKSTEFARLQRARLSSEKLYLLVEEKYNEAIIAEQSEFGYIEIMEHAVVPTAPVSPNVRVNVFLGAAMGLILGVGFVFTREYFSVRIHTPEDLKRRSFTILSTVGVMDEEVRKLEKNGNVTTDGKDINGHLLSIRNPLGGVAESYRRLRTNIQHALLDRPVRTIVITSPNPGEGKSTTASNLAVSFAQSGKKVLLIDADLRDPTLHHDFDVKKKPGLCQVLFGEVTILRALQKTVVKNLDVLTCGATPPNPTEALGSRRMRSLIKEMKGKYDLTILDSSPALVVTDPMVLSTVVDGFILVVSAGETGVDALEGACETLEGVGAKMLGVVLNKFDV